MSIASLHPSQLPLEKSVKICSVAYRVPVFMSSSDGSGSPFSCMYHSSAAQLMYLASQFRRLQISAASNTITRIAVPLTPFPT